MIKSGRILDLAGNPLGMFTRERSLGFIYEGRKLLFAVNRAKPRLQDADLVGGEAVGRSEFVEFLQLDPTYGGRRYHQQRFGWPNHPWWIMADSEES